MKDLPSKYDGAAMVVGAAEGLGAAFAQELGRRGFDLVLADIKPLKALAEEIKYTYGCTVTCVTTDLNDPGSAELLFTRWEEYSCRFLVYNAAYGPVRPFLDNTDADMDRYLNVNIKTTVTLVRKIIYSAEDRRTGILLISSMAGLRGTSYVIPYAATKAYLWNFIEGCHYEFQSEPYDFSICIPGATATPNYLATAPRKTLFSPSPASPESVAREALNKFGKRVFIIPGASNKVVNFVFTRLLPRRWASTLHNQTMKKMYDKNE